jgi:hypothetical protein
MQLNAKQSQYSGLIPDKEKTATQRRAAMAARKLAPLPLQRRVAFLQRP